MLLTTKAHRRFPSRFMNEWNELSKSSISLLRLEFFSRFSSPGSGYHVAERGRVRWERENDERRNHSFLSESHRMESRSSIWGGWIKFLHIATLPAGATRSLGRKFCYRHPHQDARIELAITFTWPQVTGRPAVPQELLKAECSRVGFQGKAKSINHRRDALRKK